MRKLLSLALLLLLFSCSYKPIFENNQKYLTAGKEKADADFQICNKLSKDYLDQYKARRVAKQAVRKGVIGAITGAITGAVWGNNSRSTLTGGLIGFGAGALVGAASIMGEGSLKPDQIQQNYISKCLVKDGYVVIGWE